MSLQVFAHFYWEKNDYLFITDFKDFFTFLCFGYEPIFSFQKNIQVVPFAKKISHPCLIDFALTKSQLTLYE